jgi:hypothetical protein
LIASGVVIVIGAAVAAVMLRVSEPSGPPVEHLRRQLAAATAGFQCAALDIAVSLDREVRVSGHLATPQEIDRLRRDITAIGGGRVVFDVGLLPWPFCEISAMLAALVGQPAREAPTLALAAKDTYIGDRLIVDVRAPGFDGYLYIDYFNTEGQVLHLFPSGRDRLNIRPIRNHFVLGCPPLLTKITLGGNPGRQLITLVATSKPLFSDPRPEVELTRDYLEIFSDAINRAKSGKRAATMLYFELRQPAADVTSSAACPSS